MRIRPANLDNSVARRPTPVSQGGMMTAGVRRNRRTRH